MAHLLNLFLSALLNEILRAGAPPIIPFPPIPVGFVPPPAAVPNPKTEESCGNDYTKTSCKDCEPLDGWCTKGEKAGCPCREECPADDDDNKPSCSADDCKGEQGSCTIVSHSPRCLSISTNPSQGHHKGCKCKSECPNPDKKILVCSDDTCKSEKDNKCTTVWPRTFVKTTYLTFTNSRRTNIMAVIVITSPRITTQ